MADLLSCGSWGGEKSGTLRSKSMQTHIEESTALVCSMNYLPLALATGNKSLQSSI